MNTQTKRIGILDLFRTMFSSEPDIDDYEDVVLPTELQDTLKSLSSKEDEVKKGFNSGNKSTKGGFAKKIDPKTEEAMRAMHNKVASKQKNTTDREIAD